MTTPSELTEHDRAALLLEEARQALLLGEPQVCLRVLKAMGRNTDWLEDQELFQAVTLAAAATAVVAKRAVEAPGE